MKRKLMTSALIIAMLAVLVAGASLAYFTDTDEATNTFTVGGVDITLTEDEWNPQDSHVLMPGKSFDKNPTITVAKDSQDCWVFLEIDMNKYVSLVNLMGVDAYKNNIAGLKGEYPGFTAFANTLASDTTVRKAVLDRWFTGINHEDWKVMNLDQISAVVADVANGKNATTLNVILGYQGGAKNGVLTATDDPVTFMTAFGMPKTITQSMMTGDDAYYINGKSKSNFNTDSADFKMTFKAYAIQAAELDTLNDAYKALFNIPAEAE